MGSINDTWAVSIATWRPKLTAGLSGPVFFKVGDPYVLIKGQGDQLDVTRSPDSDKAAIPALQQRWMCENEAAITTCAKAKRSNTVSETW
ncbi:hypothetical protein PIB30_008064 [Stylosanthes scabra]|uniref:Uncharacterized protein n=1 Tax=Stylosanthes scabra TaxID=79078 RepID=A0ABU6W5X9_9FABA|nr:hypothetical protein [Stylosanthes scabra]